jgi:hypothetical protein
MTDRFWERLTARPPLLEAELMRIPWSPVEAPKTILGSAPWGGAPAREGSAALNDTPEAVRAFANGKVWAVAWRYPKGSELCRQVSLGGHCWAFQGKLSGRLHRLEGRGPINVDKVIEFMGEWAIQSKDQPSRPSATHLTAMIRMRKITGDAVKAVEWAMEPSPRTARR